MKAWDRLPCVISWVFMLARLAVFFSGIAESIVDTSIFRAGVADVEMDAGFTLSFFFNFFIKGYFAVQPVFNHSLINPLSLVLIGSPYCPATHIISRRQRKARKGTQRISPRHPYFHHYLPRLRESHT